jgi:hypothetical protein
MFLRRGIPKNSFDRLPASPAAKKVCGFSFVSFWISRQGFFHVKTSGKVDRGCLPRRGRAAFHVKVSEKQAGAVCREEGERFAM